MNIKLPIRISETETLVTADDCWLTVEDARDIVKIVNLHTRLCDTVQELMTAKIVGTPEEWRRAIARSVDTLSEARG